MAPRHLFLVEVARSVRHELADYAYAVTRISAFQHTRPKEKRAGHYIYQLESASTCSESKGFARIRSSDDIASLIALSLAHSFSIAVSQPAEPRRYDVDFSILPCIVGTLVLPRSPRDSPSRRCRS